jgi:hypothetical protein
MIKGGSLYSSKWGIMCTSRSHPRKVFRDLGLRSRYIGPYEIKETCGPVAYQLKLPPHMSVVHDVFHVSQLRSVFAYQQKYCQNLNWR